MPRLFNVEVFNQTIGEVNPCYSGTEFNDLLGGAKMLSVQVVLDAAVQTATDIEVTFETNNTMQAQTWISSTSKVTFTGTLTALPAQGSFVVREGIGAYCRFRVTSTRPAASVRVIVCGRAN